MSEIREVDAREASAHLGDYLVVDVREAEELTGPLGCIRKAVHHPLGSVPDALEALPRDRRLLLVCRSGKRSLDACERLAARGFADVTNLAGGMIAWNDAGLPVSSGPSGAPDAAGR